MRGRGIMLGYVWCGGPQKAFNCYIFLSIWILLLVAGIYKFLDPLHDGIDSSTITYDPLFQQSLHYDVRTKKIFRICNEPHNMLPGDEGIPEEKRWSLKGLLVFIRHGDRGPLQHVRNISSIRCDTPETDLLANYKVGIWYSSFEKHLKHHFRFLLKAYLHNMTVMGRVNWVGAGSFHGFPLLPNHASLCQLGQLTFQGVSQLLTLGSILQASYDTAWRQLRNLTQNHVVVYSTRYRRTFQSALAFLFGFLGATETLNKLAFIESQSMTFCFKDCACPMAEKYLKFVTNALNAELKSHPAISYLAQHSGKAIFSSEVELGDFSKDPLAVRDALLTYVCHNSYLPCESPLTNCIRRQNVVGIFAYTDWVSHRRSKNANYKRLCALRSYGLIKHMVSHILHMISGNGPRLAVYSGHDHTLEQLASALGLPNDPTLTRYAGRLIFEVYTDEEVTNGASGAYFRLLSNGRDVTRMVSFCKNVLVTLNQKGNLCKVEDIVRFIHDDYFMKFNVTNFKDACFPKAS